MEVEVKDVRSRDQVHIQFKAPLVRLERAAGAGKAGQPLSGLETTNHGRVVTFAGAIGGSDGTVDQEVAAFKIRGVLRRASGR
jgi:hypothetical protein